MTMTTTTTTTTACHEIFFVLMNIPVVDWAIINKFKGHAGSWLIINGLINIHGVSQ